MKTDEMPQQEHFAKERVLFELHAHTDRSDGFLETKELIEEAAKQKITTLAVTDHDTVRALEEAICISKDYGIDIIPGLELSISHGKYEIHLLGYYVNFNSEGLKHGLERQLEARNLRAEEIVKKVNEENGTKIDYQKLKSYNHSSFVSKHRIAQELVNLGYVKDLNSALPLVNGDSVNVPYENYSNLFFGLEDGLDFLLKHSRLVALAHPGKLKMNMNEQKRLIKELGSKGMFGLEVYSSKNTAEQIAEYRIIANELHLVETGGTDFHAKPREIKNWAYLCSRIPIKCLYNVQLFEP